MHDCDGLRGNKHTVCDIITLMSPRERAVKMYRPAGTTVGVLSLDVCTVRASAVIRVLCNLRFTRAP